MKEIIKPTVKGLLTYVPGAERFLPVKGTGGTDSAYYCYGVWLKHLTLLWANGMRSIPDTLVELGPGDSRGVGFAAMLCGVNHYSALDVVPYSNPESDLEIFNELVELIESRAPGPAAGWPDFATYLNDDLFPEHILTDNLLREALSKERLQAIRNALVSPRGQSDGISIRYIVPWYDSDVIDKQSVDLVLSHSVLQHVSDIEFSYRAMSDWLKPKGLMSHQMDYSSMGLAKEWNGHRAYPEFLWKIAVGKRKFLINRQPHSVHMDLIRKNGFDVSCELTLPRSDGLQRADLSQRWQSISDEDLGCSGAFVQAQKI